MNKICPACKLKKKNIKNKKTHCFDCEKMITKEESIDFMNNDKLVDLCFECRARIANFACESFKQDKENCSYYDNK